jgi:hypothetical protein
VITNTGDADADPLNEIQTLTLSGNALELSGGGGNVPLPAGSFLWSATGSSISNTNTGRVGIGTTAPTAGFDVQSPSESNIANFRGTDNMFISLEEGTNYRGYIGSFSGNAEDVDFGTGSSNTSGSTHLTTQAIPRLTIVPDGQVGIGVLAPSAFLDVQDTTSSNLVNFRGDDDMYISLEEGTSYRGYIGSFSGNPEDVDFGTGGGNVTGSTHLTTQAEPRLTVKSNGEVGIGTVDPTAFFDVQNTSSANLANFRGSDNMFISLEENENYRGYIGSFSGAAADVDFGTGSGNATGSTHLTTQATPRLSILAGGRVGIGTLAPANAQLQVDNTSTDPLDLSACLRLNHPTSAIPRLSFTSGVENSNWRFDAVLDDVGSINSVFALNYEHNAATSRVPFSVRGNGTVNINALTVSDYTLRMANVNAGNFGLLIQPFGATGLNGWEITTTNTLGLVTGNMDLYADVVLKGSFDAVSGAYSNLSDRKFKTAIEPLANTLSKILLLEPSRYEFKTDAANHRKYLGFIAQDVEKLFPEVVYKNYNARTKETDYTMDYSAFGILAVKAIQEQQAQIESLKAEVAELKSQQAELKAQHDEIAKMKADLQAIKAEMLRSGNDRK